MIDHEGIIRYKKPRGPAIDQAIEDLLAKVDEIFVDDAAHTVSGTVNPVHAREAPCLERNADQ